MQFKYTAEQASKLIKLARQSIKAEFEKHEGEKTETKELKKIEMPEGKEFRQARGVFVTLMSFPKKELRGCIGFPYPTLPLAEAVKQAAKSAAFSDPRFISLNKAEINKVIIEISILTVPKEIKVKRSRDYLNKIETNKDGLIIKKEYNSGLFLPQVWKQIPNKKEFLRNLCLKAGISPNAWEKDPSVKLFKFQVQIIKEDLLVHS